MAITTISLLTNTTNSINNVAEALDFAMPYLAYPMFGIGDEVATRSGSTVQWYRHATTSEVTATRVSTSAWTPSTHSVDTVTASLSLYGDGREITEELDVQSVFDLRADLRVWAGESGGKSINAITRNTLTAAVATANYVYVNNRTSATLTSADTADLDTFVEAARLLKDQDAPPFVIDGQPCYVAIISPSVEKRLMLSSSFKSAVQFSQTQRRFLGYLATIDGICYVRSSSANGATATVTGLTTDQSLVLGRGAFGVPKLPLIGGTPNVPTFSGMAIHDGEMENNLAALSRMFRLVETRPGDGAGGGAHGDEYAEKFKVAWKALWVCKVLNSNWLYMVRSAR
jgi:N4-gp56 family major capsid protein